MQLIKFLINFAPSYKITRLPYGIIKETIGFMEGASS